jgi:hypothetical protein
MPGEKEGLADTMTIFYSFRMILNKNDSVTVGSSAIVLMIVAAINALVSVGFAIAYVFATPSDPTAGYALVRAIALVVVLAISAYRRSATAITVSGIALTLTQAGDAAVGFVAGSLATAVGPLVIALATLVCLIFFVRSVRRATPQA